jgi:sporulation protein YlmC with PRC-barrel domain
LNFDRRKLKPAVDPNESIVEAGGDQGVYLLFHSFTTKASPKKAGAALAADSAVSSNCISSRTGQEDSMAHYSTLQNQGFLSEEGEGIRGAHIYGRNDKKLGKIDDVIFDHTSGNITYVVVDTGGWLSTKRFVVPANQLNTSAKHDGDYVVDLTQEQIENFPPFDERNLSSDQEWSVYESRYRDSWSEGGILHREGSNRIVTPSPEAGQRRSGIAGGGESEQDQEADVEAAEATSDRVFPIGGNDLEQNPVSGAVGSRWENFQESLRQRRKELTATCAICGKSADAESRDKQSLGRTGT